MDFTIEIDNRDLANLKLYHKKCGGKLNKIKNIRGKLSRGLYMHFRYTVATCEKCQERIWMHYSSRHRNLKRLIEQTAVDGKARHIKGHYLNGDTSSVYLGSGVYWGKIFKNYKRRKMYNHIRDVRLGIVLKIPEKKPKEIPEKKPKKKEKLKKTIKDLKEKLAEVKKAKEKAEETIKELKEKLAKTEQTKMEPEKIYCPECGVQLVSTESFCSSCGASVENRIKEVEKVSIPNK